MQDPIAIPKGNLDQEEKNYNPNESILPPQKEGGP